MSWEQRNADFCKAQTDAQMAYIEAEREVGRLETENAKLRELVQYILDESYGDDWFAMKAKELGFEANY